MARPKGIQRDSCSKQFVEFWSVPMHRSSCANALLATAVATLAGAAASEAQIPFPAPHRLIPHVGVAAAVDARNGDSRWGDMYLGFATLEWATTVPRLGIRLEGLYGHRAEEILLSPGCGPLCTSVPQLSAMSVSSAKVRAAGALVGATYELRPIGRLRPYVVGGVGAIRSHFRTTYATTYATTSGTPWLCASTVCTLAGPAGPVLVRNERPLSAAGQLGGGAVYTWNWISVIAEARYLAVPNGTTRGLNGALPVSLGVRF
jgi:hypothetical protein